MNVAKLGFITAAVGLAALVLLPDDAEARRKRKQCFLASGDGTAINADLARVNAKTAMDGVIAKQKAKGTGKVSYSCSTTAVVVDNCRASQRACK